MPQHKHKLRVLLDLSPAGTGYAGIPQDARLTLQLLAGMPELQVTGLLFPAASHMVWPAFSRQVDPRGNWRSLAKRIPTRPLESPSDLELVWRHFLCQTLPESQRTILQTCTFVAAPLSNRMIFARAALGLPPPRLLTTAWDVAIFQGALPLGVSPATRKIIRFADLVPILHPELVANPRVTQAQRLGLEHSTTNATFVCMSDPTRTDLVRGWPALEKCSTTIPNALGSAWYAEENPTRLPQILSRRRATSIAVGPALATMGDYVLTVSTLEPRKNYPILLEAFVGLRQQLPHLRLVVVGSPGWKYEATSAVMAPLIREGAVLHLEGVAPDELRVLYTHARAFVTAALYEGFGFPPLEAMACGTPVVASDIPAHRWAMADAALYAAPTDAAGLAARLAELAGPGAAERRATLGTRGRQQIQRYTLAALAPAWRTVLLG